MINVQHTKLETHGSEHHHEAEVDASVMPGMNVSIVDFT
jgi:hypothetical protein